MSSWHRRVGTGVVVTIVLAAGLLTYARLPNRYRALLQPRFLLSREQRLIHFFGECEPGGYGYLKRVLAAYSRLEPDSRKRPVIRYRDYNRRSEYLFEPTRFEPDTSVVVGVGLTESDMPGYRVVDKRGACFTAIREERQGEWAPLILELQHSND